MTTNQKLLKLIQKICAALSILMILLAGQACKGKQGAPGTPASPGSIGATIVECIGNTLTVSLINNTPYTLAYEYQLGGPLGGYGTLICYTTSDYTTGCYPDSGTGLLTIPPNSSSDINLPCSDGCSGYTFSCAFLPYSIETNSAYGVFFGGTT